MYYAIFAILACVAAIALMLSRSQKKPDIKIFAVTTDGSSGEMLLEIAIKNYGTETGQVCGVTCEYFRDNTVAASYNFSNQFRLAPGEVVTLRTALLAATSDVRTTLIRPSGKQRQQRFCFHDATQSFMERATQPAALPDTVP